MAQKTQYTALPDAVQITELPEGKSLIRFRLNIEEIQTEGGAQYQADEYAMAVTTTPNLAQRIAAAPGVWLERARQETPGAGTTLEGRVEELETNTAELGEALDLLLSGATK